MLALCLVMFHIIIDMDLIFSSLEHEVLRVSCCDRALSVVRRPSSTFYLVYALEVILSVRNWTAAVAYLLERPVVGLIPGRDRPTSLKLVVVVEVMRKRSSLWE